MIKIGQRVRKKGNKDFYLVLKIFDTFVEVDKLHKNWLERMSNLTEYVNFDRLEEYIDERTDRNAPINTE